MVDSQKRSLSKTSKSKAPRKKAKVEGTETPHGIPMEILQQILGYVTDFQDIWHVGQVNQIFESIAWSTVQSLEFVWDEFSFARCSNFPVGSMYIRQNTRDPTRFGAEFRKVLNVIPGIWKRSLNLRGLEFRIAVSPGRAGGSIVSAADDFGSMIQDLQIESPRQIEHICLNPGFEEFNAFWGVLASCSAQLKSLKALCSLSDYYSEYAVAAARCSNITSVETHSSNLLRALLPVPSVRELSFENNCESESILSDCLTSVDLCDNVVLRIQGNFWTRWPSNNYWKTFDFSRVTALAVSMMSKLIIDAFNNIPNLVCVLVIVSGTCCPCCPYRGPTAQWVEVVEAFLNVHRNSSVQRTLLMKILQDDWYHEDIVNEVSLFIQENLNAGSRRIVRLKDVVETGGVEVNDGEGEEYWKFVVGRVTLFIGPVL